MKRMQDCLFCKIVAGAVPAIKLFEDADVLAFHDIRPIAPVHFLIIPKVHVETLYEVGMDDHTTLGKMLALTGGLARQAGATDGFRTIVNCGRVGHQEVYHLHMHVIGGPEPLGPMIMRKK